MRYAPGLGPTASTRTRADRDRPRGQMNVIELARAFLDDAPIGIVITDAQPAKPGPIILYANAAFGALTGTVVGGTITVLVAR